MSRRGTPAAAVLANGIRGWRPEPSVRNSAESVRVMVANHGEWVRDQVRRENAAGRVHYCDCSRCRMSAESAKEVAS